MSTAIEFHNVSKKYILRHQRPSALKEALPLFFSRLFNSSFSPEEFWALKDVSFAVEKGDALGFIGPNGAGKSTILKLLSGITLPTKGKISVGGKVAALIEVGAGFHPDLTGRENIYLNGSILGLKKKEIDNKFDSIVDFAELEEFIDTPVKRYSSGMFVRLGFAVAAHMEPDILLVDEVLAVGDMAFKNKCISRINEIKSSGSTIVFVSHSLSQVEQLCSRTIWLEDGAIKMEGDSRKVAEAYSDNTNIQMLERQKMQGQVSPERWGTGEATIKMVKTLDREGRESDFFLTGDTMRVHIEYAAGKPLFKPNFWVAVMNESGLKVCGAVNRDVASDGSPMLEGEGAVECVFESLPVLPGIYHLVVGIFDHTLNVPYDRWGRVAGFTISAGGKDAGAGLKNPDFFGIAYAESRWEKA